MKRNRYWATGALSTVLIIFTTFIPTLFGLFPAQGIQISNTAPWVNGAQLAELRQPNSDAFDASITTLNQGRQAYQEGRYVAAVQQFQQTVEIAAKLNLILDQAQALSFLSLAQQKLGDWSAAEHSIAQSLDLANRVKTSREQQLILGRAFNTQGSLLFAKGQSEAALKSWQSAEAAYREAKDETRQLGSLINQSQALQSLGFYGRTRRILEDIHKRLENQPPDLKMIGLRNLGNTYSHIGKLQESKDVLHDAIALAKHSNQPQQLAAALLSFGNTTQAGGEQEKALGYYKRAAQLGSGELQFQAILHQFQLLIHRNQATQARRLVPALETQLSQLPPSRSVLYGATHFSIGLTQLALPDHPTRRQETLTSLNSRSKSNRKSNRKSWHASNQLDNSLDNEDLQLATQTLTWVIQTAQDLKDARAETYGRGYLGHLYERSQQWDTAQDLTQAALTQAERINADDISYQWQWQLARILKVQDQFPEAQAAYKNAYESLQDLRRDLVATQPDLQFSFQESIEPIYREFVDLLLRPQADGSKPTSKNLDLARQVIESLQVAELNNFFRTACLEEQVVPLEEIDQQEGTAVIYPIILPDRITIILSLPGQDLQSYETKVTQSEVETTLRDLRLSLERPYFDTNGDQPVKRVYDWLIAPIKAELSEIQTLTFVLDGALRNVPMAALHDGKDYLIEHYSIGLTPGLQLLAPNPLQLHNKRALIAGITEERHGFSGLPHVGQELDAIEDYLPSKRLLNDEFTREALEKNVRTSDFPVVHLATHGKFGAKAEDSFILAWDKLVNITDFSSALRNRERPDPIELLVLSACETATGDRRAVLGLAGLAVQAGARSTLASLWSLDDESGAELIKHFYQALAENEGISRAAALQKAQKSMLKQPKYKTPRNWAPYVLIGNWV